MIETWQTKPLGSVILPGVTVDPTNAPDKIFRYVDVSSVSNRSFEIEKSVDISGRDAPSRARKQIKAGDVIFATIRPTLKRIAVVPDHLDGAVCSTAYFVFRPQAAMDGRFLFYYLFTDKFIGAMEILQTGASYPAVNDGQVKAQEISFPPFPEQKRIVAILDEAFEGIGMAVANAEKNLTNARALFESYLIAILKTGGDQWNNKSLGSVCDLFQGLAINKGTKHLLVHNSKLPLLRIKDLRDETAEQYVAETGFPKNAEIFPQDIIYTRTGQIGLVFRGRRGILHNNSFKVVPRSELDRSYLFWLLQEPSFRRRIVALASRTAQPDITHKLFQAEVIPIPPMDYQREAVAKIEKLYADTQSLSVLYRQKIGHIVALKEALLQKAFAGELTAQSVAGVQEVAE